MEGYDHATYGDGFADVYDDWYGDVTDVEATVTLVADLAGPSGRVLELGVGTGRLALPLARAGLAVTGVDTSEAMLRRLDDRVAALGGTLDGSIDAVCGDMVDDLPDTEFDVVLAAYNTLFNLLDEDRQRACFAAVARIVRPDGCFVVETATPDPTAPAGRDVGVRTMATDRVVLTVTDHRPAEQRTFGQFVELTEADGVRLRPWAIRWASPAELDTMAAAAGFRLEARWADVSRATHDPDGDRQVALYRRTA